MAPGTRMTLPDIIPQLKSALPQLRGRLLANEPLAPLTWFRVGGPAQALFVPQDESDLAYGRATKAILVEGRGVDRAGTIRTYSNAEMGFSYRHCGVPEDVIFTEALFEGAPGDPAAIAAEMDEITSKRETTQPVKSRTGGSTFKNPPGHKAWQLIDAAGCRGLVIGDAQVSELHCNFLINRGNASAADIENLGEEVRRRVRENSGVELEWEIKRIGVKP